MERFRALKFSNFDLFRALFSEIDHMTSVDPTIVNSILDTNNPQIPYCKRPLKLLEVGLAIGNSGIAHTGSCHLT